MSLDIQGIISAVTLAIYVPVFNLTSRISYRWLLLVIFSLIRIVGGALLVAAGQVVPVVTGLDIGGYALEASGLSPLLLSALGLLGIVTEGPDEEKKHTRPFRILHIAGAVGLTLMIISISDSSSSNAAAERRAGVIIFAALYICLVAVTVMQWAKRYQLMKYRRQLLVAVLAALPFLAFRTLCSVLSTFSSDSFVTLGTSITDSKNAMAKFDMFTEE